jgi:hypothetical protein
VAVGAQFGVIVVLEDGGDLPLRRHLPRWTPSRVRGFYERRG